ncbi:MAG: hypothetical protein FJ202_09095, partial [Gemmatimonadetes bacterium]|nr:hypothetical protein [Gemmatimonadota bacterium]
MSRQSRSVTGVALGAREVCTAGGAQASVQAHAVVAEQGEDQSVALGRAVGAVFAGLAGTGAGDARSGPASVSRVAVALLSPLTELRALHLPPLDDRARARLIGRNANRYFVGARGPQVIGSLDIGANGDGAHTVLAAVAAEPLITTLETNAAAAGLTIASFVPAEAAWTAAAVAAWPAFARGIAACVVAHEDRLDVLTMRDGALVGVRRVRSGDNRDLIRVVGDAGARDAGVFGAAAAANATLAALSAAGIRTQRVPAGFAGDGLNPAALAARFAPSAAGPRLMSERARDDVARAEVRGAWRMAGLAAAVMLVAAAVHFVGERRELDDVRAARAAVRARVESTLADRVDVEAVYRQVAELARQRRDAPRWSLVLASLTDALPDAAWATAVRVRGDSVFMD